MNRFRGARITAGLGVSLLAALAATAPGCSEETTPELLAELGEGCLINSDCGDPLVCAFRRCHNQCETSKDCDVELRCVLSDKPYRVCQLPDENVCGEPPQCPGEQICGQDGECRDACNTNQDCITPQVCVLSLMSGGATKLCAEPDELVGGALPVTTPPPDAGTLPEGTPCQYHSDCLDPLVCRDGLCAFECKADKDCAAGNTCEGNVCVGGTSTSTGTTTATTGAGGSTASSGNTGTGGSGGAGAGGGGGAGGAPGAGGAGGGLPPGYGTPCNLQSDCLAFGLICGLGGECVYQCNLDIDCPGFDSCCKSHTCLLGPACQGGGGQGGGGGGQGGGGLGGPCSYNEDCDDQLWCNGGEVCFAGQCAPAADTPCNSHSSCVKDTCSEPMPPSITGSCVHMQQAGEDIDGDGHMHLLCQGGDDCDDSPGGADVYAGAVEACDLKDNDCDGLADENTRAPKGGVNTHVGYISTTGQGYAVPFGNVGDTMLIGLEGSPQVVTAVIDAQGATKAATALMGMGVAPDSASSAASSPTSVLYTSRVGSSTNLFATVLTLNGSAVSATPVLVLDQATATASFTVDSVWTGAHYLIAFKTDATVGRYAAVEATGALVGAWDLPTMPGSTLANTATAVRVASSGSQAIAMYQRPGDAHVEAAVLYPTGGNFAANGTVELPFMDTTLGAKQWSVAGADGGYVAAWWDVTGAHAAYFEIDPLLQLGGVTSIPLPPGTTSGTVRSDGPGAALLLQAPSEIKFGYWRPDLPNPFETTSDVLITSQPCMPSLTTFGPRIGIACNNSNQELRWRRAGCP